MELFEAVFIIVLVVFAPVILYYIRHYANIASDGEKQYIIDSVIEIGVMAAEQLGYSSDAALAHATEVVQRQLAVKGIDLPVGVIVDRIEATVHRLYNS